MSGWKDWAIGEVVTESEFQSFVQDQVVQVYDDATDRDNTLGANVTEGMVCYLKDTNATLVYDSSQWIAIGEGDITGVTAGDGLTGGGTSGDVSLDVDMSYINSNASIDQSQVTDLVSDLSGKASTTHASTHESGGSDEIEIAQSQVTGLDTGTEGQVVLSDGTSGVKFETGYVFRETVYFESSGTFSKASYPWLKAMRVKVQAAGAAGGGAKITNSSQISVGSGGGSGGLSESFITDIASLDSSVSITVGAGGSGVPAGIGGNGGNSSFGSLVTANGGSGGGSGGAFPDLYFAPVAGAASLGIGDLAIGGFAGDNGFSLSTVDFRQRGGRGGDSLFGGGGRATQSGSSGNDGRPGVGLGSGGAGAASPTSESSEKSGGNGADGIVILELFA